MKNNTTWIILAIVAVLILVIIFAKPGSKNTDEQTGDETSNEEFTGTGGPDDVAEDTTEGETADPSEETPGFPKTGVKPE